MEHLKDILTESLLDIDKGAERTDAIVFLKVSEKQLQKGLRSSTKKPLDMFGRKIGVGDVCFAYITMEYHMIQVKEIIDDGGWPMIVPTADYKNIDGRGTVDPYNCILIPKNCYNEFLKVIKK